ncbi:MAG: diguanylate cyclase [Planctomycetota bacterium]|nr:diguanylate cyclase [Planctomycetota bacterium]
MANQSDRYVNFKPAPRILVVDDDIHFLKLVKKVLSDHGMQVMVARDADEAKEKLKQSRPELIISDLLMPGTSGEVFCRELQDDPETADIPFIFVSAVRDPKTRVSTFEVGAADYLVKPIFMDELAAKVTSMVRKNRTTRVLMLTDALTGVRNRWFFEEELPRLVLQAKRGGWHMSLVIVDINSFKKINDQYSHSFGDHVLTSVADQLKKVFRASDVIIRYGGDEFVIALPETKRKKAIKALDRLFEIFRDFTCTTDDRERVRITLAAGLSTFPEDGKDLDTSFAAADAALYRVKKVGKNGFAVAGDENSKYFYE